MFFPFHDDNPTERFPWVTVGLILINVLTFVQLQRLPQQKQIEQVVYHGFIPARIGGLLSGKEVTVAMPLQREVLPPWVGRERIEQRIYHLRPNLGEVARSLLTCMFLHAGWAHLIGNMWFLWLFGNNVEDRLGSTLYLLFYLLGGLFASGVHWLTDPSSTLPVIGASGAISAVLGAYAVTWPWAQVHTLVFLGFWITWVDLPAWTVLGFWFLGQLLEGVHAISLGIAGGVAWWAHIGGFLVGLFLMPPLRNSVDQYRLTQWRRRFEDWPPEDSDAW